VQRQLAKPMLLHHICFCPYRTTPHSTNFAMAKYLLFSDKLKQIGLFVNSQFLKIGNLLTILFKRRRKLEKISFDYYMNWHFDNAYLVVDFKFKNAVGYKVGEFKSFDFSKPIILNLENIQSVTINFEVFGFFQKQVYVINLNRDTRINTQPFKTKIDNINMVKLVQQKTRIRIPKIGLHIADPTFVFEKIAVKTQNIQINYQTFKTQDYI
jgi:hypothetical protein